GPDVEAVIPLNPLGCAAPGAPEDEVLRSLPDEGDEPVVSEGVPEPPMVVASGTPDPDPSAALAISDREPLPASADPRAGSARTLGWGEWGSCSLFPAGPPPGRFVSPADDGLPTLPAPVPGAFEPDPEAIPPEPDGGTLMGPPDDDGGAGAS